MKRVEIKLSQPIVAPLLDFVKPIAEELHDEVVIELRFPDTDPHFQEAWKEDLVEGQTMDAKVFMGLFGSEFFETGTIVVDETNADSVLRATAAIRLKLRIAFLSDVSDEVLESGEVPFDDLGQREQQAYACYLFLATVQEIVIQHLDIAGGR